MGIDSHCHLDFEPLIKNLDQVIKKANDVGVEYFLTICTDENSFKKIILILKNQKKVFGTYGIHPHEAKKYGALKIEHIIKSLNNNKIIGVGETGLDLYYEHSDYKSQKTSFVKHIHASQDTTKALIVHSRNAEKETLDILSSEYKNKQFKILMHCFTGSKSFAHKLLDIGCYFSASGIITFKKNKDLVDTFKSIPNDRILVETDSPYLSPEPVRGKINEPSNLIHTIKYLSKIKAESEKSIDSLTTKNFVKLFNLNL